MYREKGGNCTLAPRHFSLLSNLLFLFASGLRIITMHLCIVFYITVCVDIYSMPERTRSKSEQFEESIPTGFIPTDRFLEFCDSSFFEDDRIQPRSSPPFLFGSSRNFRSRQTDFTRYRTRCMRCTLKSWRATFRKS